VTGNSDRKVRAYPAAHAQAGRAGARPRRAEAGARSSVGHVPDAVHLLP
jgi:hypothetical protein